MVVIERRKVEGTKLEDWKVNGRASLRLKVNRNSGTPPVAERELLSYLEISGKPKHPAFQRTENLGGISVRNASHFPAKYSKITHRHFLPQDDHPTTIVPSVIGSIPSIRMSL
jgi:hypothetical protein